MDELKTVKNWFSSRVDYSGRGRAEFRSPRGSVEGPVTVKLNEFGQETVTMEVEGFESEEPLRFGLMQLFNGSPLVEHSDGSVSMGIGGTENTCTRLVVTSDDGIFEATRGIYYGYGLGIAGSSKATLNFHLFRSTFEPHEKSTPCYWVLPLSNFLSKFTRQHPGLLSHPLRISYLGRSANSGSENKKPFNDFIIPFEHCGEIGFIEPLPQYKQLEESLLSGQERHAVTALMVGSIASRSIEDDEVDSWAPFDYLRLLTVATGCPVGSPWVEFRDSGGNLVRRLHTRVEMAPFEKAHRPIDELVHSGTGYLLTRFASSAHRGQSHLNVLLKHLASAASYSNSIEDEFVYLCRAFEVLCDHHGLKRQHLVSELDDSQKQIVKDALRTAHLEIQQAANASALAGKHAQSRALTRIAERARSTPANIDRDFGLAVAELLTLFDLPDADIIDGHYLTNPRSDGIPKWAGVLSFYRGVTIHEGFFQFETNRHDFDDIIRIKDHLHDILLRIVFNLIGYIGTYQPPVIKLTTSVSVQWVDVNTSALTLGYR